jgi:hypothetical protein
MQGQAKEHLRACEQACMQWLAAGAGLLACKHAEGQRSRMQGGKWPVLACIACRRRAAGYASGCVRMHTCKGRDFPFRILIPTL